MSVDTLRETFHINRITPDKIQDFLTAQTYRPEITTAKEKIKTLPWVPLQSVCKRPIRQGKSPSYAEGSGLLCIKPKNTNEMIVSLEELSYIQPASKDEVAGQRLQRGDIVITRSGSGTIGRASIFQSDEEVYTNDHLFIVRTDAVDSHYTCAFLNTYWGHRLLEAGISGSTGQLNLSNEHIKGISLYTPAELVQKYIGDKVRQAERLRALAQRLEQNANSIFQEEFQWDGTVLSVTPFNRLRVDELENRLDLKFNSPQRLAAVRHAKKVNAKLQQLDGLVDISAMIGWKGLTTDHYTSLGPWLLRGVEFSSGVIRTEDLVCVDEYKYLEQPQIHLKEGDIALTKDGTIGKAIVIPRLTNQMAAGSTVARLRKKPAADVDAYYLEFALAHEFVQCQIASFATGVAQPHITQEWIALLQIPRIKSENEVASAWQQHHISLNFAKHLTNAAKLLVEALIEGQLTEAELLTAEKALQAGNNRLDRLILSRLNTDGIDGQGPALFNDLDELHCLLAQAGGD